MEENKANESFSQAPNDKKTDKKVESVKDEKTESTPTETVGKEKPSEITPKKGFRWWGLIILAVLLVLVSYQSYRAFFGGSPEETTLPEIPDLNKNTNQVANANTNAAKPTNTNSGKTNKNTNPTLNPTPVPVPTPTPEPPASPAFDPIEFFVEVATGYKTISGNSKRWIKNPVYVGGKESDFTPLYSDCLNQFIDGFNASSNDVKLVRNAELADIKIYWVTQQELNERYNPDSGRAFATWTANNGVISEGEVFMPIDGDFVDDLKCYTMKHEVMHGMGFAHSDQSSYSLMGMPSQGRNLVTGLTDVDKRAIQMLYSSGLSIKQNADQIREFFKGHSY